MFAKKMAFLGLILALLLTSSSVGAEGPAEPALNPAKMTVTEFRWALENLHKKAPQESQEKAEPPALNWRVWGVSDLVDGSIEVVFASSTEDRVIIGTRDAGAAELNGDSWDWFNPLELATLEGSSISAIGEGPNGEIYYGVYQFCSCGSPNYWVPRGIVVQGTNGEWSAWNNGNSGLGGNHVVMIKLDQLERVWFGSSAGYHAPPSFSCQEPSQHWWPPRLVLLEKDYFLPLQVNGTVEDLAFYEDDPNGWGWVASWGEGASQIFHNGRTALYDVEEAPFEFATSVSIHGNKVAFGTCDAGPVVLDTSSGEWEWTILNQIPAFIEGLGHTLEHVFDVQYDQKGGLWMATIHGLYLWDGQELHWYYLGKSPLPGMSVRDLAVNKQGHIWAAVDNGVAQIWYPLSKVYLPIVLKL